MKRRGGGLLTVLACAALSLVGCTAAKADPPFPDPSPCVPENLWVGEFDGYVMAQCGYGVQIRNDDDNCKYLVSYKFKIEGITRPPSPPSIAGCPCQPPDPSLLCDCGYETTWGEWGDPNGYGPEPKLELVASNQPPGSTGDGCCMRQCTTSCGGENACDYRQINSTAFDVWVLEGYVNCGEELNCPPYCTEPYCAPPEERIRLINTAVVFPCEDLDPSDDWTCCSIGGVLPEQRPQSP